MNGKSSRLQLAVDKYTQTSRCVVSANAELRNVTYQFYVTSFVCHIRNNLHFSPTPKTKTNYKSYAKYIPHVHVKNIKNTWVPLLHSQNRFNNSKNYYGRKTFIESKSGEIYQKKVRQTKQKHFQHKYIPVQLQTTLQHAIIMQS